MGGLARRLAATRTVRRLDLGEPDARWYPRVLADRVVGTHRPGTRTLVVCNTVERAAAVHAAVHAASSGQGPDVVLLHSRFRPGDRRDRTAEALAAPGPRGTVVVATQVLEAGVDLTSDTLVTEVAPWTSIVQRAGRCNRDGLAATGQGLRAAVRGGGSRRDHGRADRPRGCGGHRCRAGGAGGRAGRAGASGVAAPGPARVVRHGGPVRRRHRRQPVRPGHGRPDGVGGVAYRRSHDRGVRRFGGRSGRGVPGADRRGPRSGGWPAPGVDLRPGRRAVAAGPRRGRAADGDRGAGRRRRRVPARRRVRRRRPHPCRAGRRAGRGGHRPAVGAGGALGEARRAPRRTPGTRRSGCSPGSAPHLGSTRARWGSTTTSHRGVAARTPGSGWAARR